MTGVPYRALALGAGPFILGLLPAARALPYSLTTVWAGGLTEGRERLRLARLALVIATLSIAALVAAPGLAGLFLCLGVLGIALAFFWPAVQAALADLAGQRGVTANLGGFNVAWSSGKAMGFLVGGAVLSGLGFGALFTLAAAALVSVIVLLARVRVASPSPTLGETRPASPDDSGPGGAVPRGSRSTASPRVGARTVTRFRLAAWIANAVAFGVVSVLNLQYPEWLRRVGHGEALFGTYLGLVFLSQTGAFIALWRFSGWQYRAFPLLLAQVPVVIVLGALPLLAAPGLILATAPLIGLGLGMTYFASLFYSVAEAGRRGRYAGVHEAVLGAGSLALPIGGGALAKALGHLEAPYVFAALVGMLSLVAQAALLAGARTGSPALPGEGGTAAPHPG
jgi:MFS family permease